MQAVGGWRSFGSLNNIVFKSICGQSINVGEKVLVEWKSRLLLILAGYSDRDTYTLDETGLFFHA